MPIRTERDDTRRRVTVILQGAVTYAHVEAFLRSDAPVPGGNQPYDILVDMRRAHVDLSLGYDVEALAALATERNPTRKSGRIALVASDDALLGVARRYGVYRGQSG